jgi:putative heme-binding domain-containing protein
MENARRKRRVGAYATAALAAACSVGSFHAQEHVGEYARADIEHGARLYADNCSTCHGVNGDALAGVSLRTGRFRRASTDLELMRLIRAGLPDAAMPPGQYTQSELSGIVAFVRTMGEIDPSTLTLGDATRGQVVFEGKAACLDCHRVAGQGSRRAPELTAIAASRTAGALERSLLDPTGSMLPVNRPIRMVTRSGDVINGRRLNEDTFTIQIVDEREQLVSLDKSELQEIAAATTSPMPAFGDRLTEQELSDLLAYLLTLKG